MDFECEVAAFDSATSVFNDAQIKLCYFHYGKSIRQHFAKKIKTIDKVRKRIFEKCYCQIQPNIVNLNYYSPPYPPYQQYPPYPMYPIVYPNVFPNAQYPQ